ncbi:restriction endonuclease subunit S [Methylomonas koyamae]|uniref:restriction endonuclease subunit S n=1 Tax=Methylomonas koyamae TaxID=702114 RepID=UPI002873E332|nr:restriction endonuclease subunit S [Methylomonas koyamae]WNB76017.1 restriction endonuclease subunit S [Methylomonas koyamae]
MSEVFGYHLVPLHDVARRITDGSHFSPTPREYGYLIANVKDMKSGEIDLSTCTRISPSAYRELKATGCTIKNGNVLLSKDGTVGRVVVYRQDEEIGALSSICIIEPDDQLDAAFLGQALQSEGCTRQYDNFMSGSALRRLVLRDIRSIKVPLPESEHQRAIAKILDTLDTAIHETEAIIAKLKAIKQGLLHDLLTRGIDANGELRPPQNEAPHLYKESPLGWIPKEWDVQPLECMANVSRGKFTHRPRNDPRFYGGKHPFIQTGDVAAAEGEFVSTYSQTLSDRGISVSQEFPVGTIAITIAANIADTAILAIPMYFPDSVVGAIVDKAYNIRFVELSIRKAKRILDARAPQSAQKNINLQDLRPLLLAVPEKPEQDAIAILYETLQNQLQNECDALAKYRFEKSGLMDDLLTGRVRVTPLLEGTIP